MNTIPYANKRKLFLNNLIKKSSFYPQSLTGVFSFFISWQDIMKNLRYLFLTSPHWSISHNLRTSFYWQPQLMDRWGSHPTHPLTYYYIEIINFTHYIASYIYLWGKLLTSFKKVLIDCDSNRFVHSQSIWMIRFIIWLEIVDRVFFY